jgi:hypothetical protein
MPANGYIYYNAAAPLSNAILRPSTGHIGHRADHSHGLYRVLRAAGGYGLLLATSTIESFFRGELEKREAPPAACMALYAVQTPVSTTPLACEPYLGLE